MIGDLIVFGAMLREECDADDTGALLLAGVFLILVVGIALA